MPVEGIGCPTAATRNNSPAIDIIEFFEKRSPRIIEEIAPLYRKGLSITDIQAQTGMKRHAIWNALRKHRVELRAADPVSFKRWRQGRGKTRARPPYGFSYFQGEVIKDPVEYPTLQLIASLLKQGMSISSIVLRLNSKGIKSRMKKPWSYNVIKFTIARLKDGSNEELVAPQKSKKSETGNTGARK